MKDPELDILIQGLESRNDLTIADFDGVGRALCFLLPDVMKDGANVKDLGTTEGAILIADDAFPNWSVNIHGRANNKDGHWHCTLRESDGRDNDAAIGSGRSPVLAQAILAAVLRVSMILKKE